jgi:hypothetical protein
VAVASLPLDVHAGIPLADDRKPHRIRVVLGS